MYILLYIHIYIIYIYMYVYIYVFIYGFKKFKQIILLINTNCQLKVLLANYICFNLSKFPPKKNLK